MGHDTHISLNRFGFFSPGHPKTGFGFAWTLRLALSLILVCCLALISGCSGKVTRDEFDGLTGRVDKLEQTVYRGGSPTSGAFSSGEVTAPGALYSPGGVGGVDPAFQAAFGPPSGQYVQSLPSGQSSQKSSASERSRYNRARSLLNQKKYAQAATAFSEMIRDFPGGKLAPNARYWLGECRYAVGDYSGAFLEFRQGYHDYPQSNKAADCLLKMSYCQSLLGDGPGAMETLRVLLANYPDSDSARLVTSGRGRFSGL